MVNVNTNGIKKWYSSKTLWVNTLLVVGGILTSLAEVVSSGTAISIVGIANIILRVLTKTQLKK